MRKLQQVIKHFGGTQESLADALGIKREAVSMWRGKIPLARAYQIESLSGGKFKAADLLKSSRKKANAGDSDRRAAAG